MSTIRHSRIHVATTISSSFTLLPLAAITAIISMPSIAYSSNLGKNSISTKRLNCIRKNLGSILPIGLMSAINASIHKPSGILMWPTTKLFSSFRESTASSIGTMEKKEISPSGYPNASQNMSKWLLPLTEIQSPWNISINSDAIESASPMTELSWNRWSNNILRND